MAETKLVKMVKDGKYADVHPTNVADMKAHDWKVVGKEEPADPQEKNQAKTPNPKPEGEKAKQKGGLKIFGKKDGQPEPDAAEPDEDLEGGEEFDSETADEPPTEEPPAKGRAVTA